MASTTQRPYEKQYWKPDITAKFTNGCIIRVRNKNSPGVINQYAPGEFYAVTESDIWLMRYHKNILFAVNCKTTRKNKFEIKVFIFGSKKNICTFALKLSPRTGIVRNNMNIRKDKELNILAKAAGKKATEVETIIVNQLIQKEMIQDDPEFWGCTLFDSIERDVPVSDVVGIIKATGISVVRSEHLDAFLNLVLVGKGDCPVCGGEMEVTDADYKCCGGDGYLTPYEYEPIFEEKTCKHCGHVE